MFMVYRWRVKQSTVSNNTKFQQYSYSLPQMGLPQMGHRLMFRFPTFEIFGNPRAGPRQARGLFSRIWPLCWIPWTTTLLVRVIVWATESTPRSPTSVNYSKASTHHLHPPPTSRLISNQRYARGTFSRRRSFVRNSSAFPSSTYTLSIMWKANNTGDLLRNVSSQGSNHRWISMELDGNFWILLMYLFKLNWYAMSVTPNILILTIELFLNVNNYLIFLIIEKHN